MCRRVKDDINRRRLVRSDLLVNGWYSAVPGHTKGSKLFKFSRTACSASQTQYFGSAHARRIDFFNSKRAGAGIAQGKDAGYGASCHGDTPKIVRALTFYAQCPARGAGRRSSVLRTRTRNPNNAAKCDKCDNDADNYFVHMCDDLLCN